MRSLADGQGIATLGRLGDVLEHRLNGHVVLLGRRTIVAAERVAEHFDRPSVDGRDLDPAVLEKMIDQVPIRGLGIFELLVGPSLALVVEVVGRLLVFTVVGADTDDLVGELASGNFLDDDRDVFIQDEVLVAVGMVLADQVERLEVHRQVVGRMQLGQRAIEQRLDFLADGGRELVFLATPIARVEADQGAIQGCDVVLRLDVGLFVGDGRIGTFAGADLADGQRLDDLVDQDLDVAAVDVADDDMHAGEHFGGCLPGGGRLKQLDLGDLERTDHAEFGTGEDDAPADGFADLAAVFPHDGERPDGAAQLVIGALNLGRQSDLAQGLGDSGGVQRGPADGIDIDIDVPARTRRTGSHAELDGGVKHGNLRHSIELRDTKGCYMISIEKHPRTFLLGLSL